MKNQNSYPLLMKSARIYELIYLVGMTFMPQVSRSTGSPVYPLFCHIPSVSPKRWQWLDVTYWNLPHHRSEDYYYVDYMISLYPFLLSDTLSNHPHLPKRNIMLNNEKKSVLC